MQKKAQETEAHTQKDRGETEHAQKKKRGTQRKRVQERMKRRVSCCVDSGARKGKGIVVSRG